MITEYELVARFASKDSTRYHLNFCVYNEHLGALVATDGHRLIVHRGCSLRPGTKNYRADVYLKTGEFLESKDFGKYPDVRQFIPDAAKLDEQSFEFDVPNWFTKIERERKPVKIGFSKDGIASLNRFKDLFCLDARLLGPLAGMRIKMQWQKVNPALNPVVFTLVDDKNVSGVIMPIRA